MPAEEFLDTRLVTLADQLARFDVLIEPLGPLVAEFVSSTLRERLAALPEGAAESFLREACDAADEADDDLGARLRALSRRPYCATTPEAPTHTIAELIEASDERAVVGAVAGRITDTWRTHGYAEYRVGDGAETLVIGVHGRPPAEIPDGQRVLVTVELPRDARAVTEPIDPQRPSILGAVAATLIGFRAV
jgi:hypothetical protein